MMLFYSCLCLCLLWTVNSQNTNCNNDRVGIDNPDGKDTVTVITDAYFLACAGVYVSGCCARIVEWEYRAEIVEPVELMVWRQDPAIPTNYILVAKETVTPTKVDDNAYTPPSQKIIQSGDCLGWHATGLEVINYKGGGDGIQVQYLTGILAPALYESVDWSGATPDANADSEWSINVQVSPSRDPVFPTQLLTYDIPENTTAGTTVATVTFTDPDGQDVISIGMTSTPTGYLNFTDNGDGTGYIQTTTSVETLSATTIDVTFTATDSCLNTQTGAFQVNVINYPPTLTGLNPGAEINECIRSETLLATYTCSDMSGVVTVDTAIVPVNDPPFFFSKYLNGSYVYGIYSSAGANLDYAQRTHNITISCSDSSETVTDKIIISLLENVPPVITNLPDTVYINRTTTRAGDVIFTVEYADTEGDQVSLSLSSGPTANAPFTVLSSGQVQATQDIDQVNELSWNLFIDIQDIKSSGKQATLVVIVTGYGTPVSFTNLPYVLPVYENTAVGTSLFKILYNGNPETFYMTSPDGGTALFNLDYTTGDITTIAEINYEGLATKQFPMTVVLLGDTSSATSTLTITIVDVNEPLTWRSDAYRATITERQGFGTVMTDPGFAIYDPDINDTYTCTMDCGDKSGYYVMSASCVVTVASVYSLDANLPNTVTCVMTAVDTNPYTATSTLIITIEEANNHTPTFSYESYTFSLSPYSVAGTTVGTVTAVDQDVGVNGSFSYALIQSDPEYFTIDAGLGLIQTSRDILTACPQCAGTTLTARVTATDTGGLSSTSTVYITVVTTTTIPTTVEPIWYKSFFDDIRNVIWFSLAMVLLGLMFIVGSFICFKYVWYYDGKWCHFKKESVYWRPREAESLPNFEDEVVSCRKQIPQGGHSWQRDMMF